MSGQRLESYRLETGLSDREVFLIGEIIVQWGALEHELFTQVVLARDDGHDQGATLPGALQFTKLLRLWKECVVDRAQGEHADALRLQLDEITKLKEFRDALVHGMWHWSAAELTRISTVRVRGKQVITTHFTVNELQEFADRVASINFRIRYPGGLEDLARARAEGGPVFSRMGLAMLTGDRLIDDWLSAPSLNSEKAK